MSRKIISLLIAILLMSGIAFAATPGSNLSPGEGEIVNMPYQSTPPARYRIVRYNGNNDTDGLTDQAIVVWDTTEDDGVTITTTTTSNDSTVAGIIVQACLTQDVNGNSAAQDIGKDNWTWLQTYGYSTVNVDVIVAVGDAMGTGATAEEAGVFTPSTSDGTKQGYAGFFFDTAAAGANAVQCFVRTE